MNDVSGITAGQTKQLIAAAVKAIPTSGMSSEEADRLLRDREFWKEMSGSYRCHAQTKSTLVTPVANWVDAMRSLDVEIIFVDEVDTSENRLAVYRWQSNSVTDVECEVISLGSELSVSDGRSELQKLGLRSANLNEAVGFVSMHRNSTYRVPGHSDLRPTFNVLLDAELGLIATFEQRFMDREAWKLWIYPVDSPTMAFCGAGSILTCSLL